MRIALICSDRAPCPPVRGGAIQLLISRLAPLFARTHEVTVFSVADPELATVETVKGVRYERYPKNRFFESVCRRLGEEAFDIIQVYNRPAWVPSLREAAPDAAIILSMHNLVCETVKVTPEEADKGIRQADLILAVSRFVADHTVQKAPEAAGKTRVLYTGVDLSEYAPLWTKRGRKWRKQIRKRHRIGDREQVILFVGRLVPYKGCHLILKAMRKIVKPDGKRPRRNVKLLIVGSKWYADNGKDAYIRKLERLARNLSDHVRFASFVPVDEIPKYYSAADLFICASQWKEPLARVHYEAMAAGLPIITTRRGGNHEVVRNGRNGLVIKEYRNPGQFAKEVNRLLSDPRRMRKMGVAGRELVEKIYNFERMAEDLESIYAALAAGTNGRREDN